MRLPPICLTLVLALSAIGYVSAQAQGGGSAPSGQATPVKEIQKWFGAYDQIRRQDQMNPQERAQADKAMAGGLSMFMPGEEKAAAQNFLRTMAQRDANAAQALKQLPLYPETKQLHIGYYQYFSNASALKQDYIKLQDHPLSKDENGQPLAAGVAVRKQNLEVLDQNNKALDAQLRQQFGVAPYRY
jgi:hypothetical protein